MNEIRTYFYQFIFSIKGAVITPLVILGTTMFFGWLTATVGADIPPDEVAENITSVSNIVSDLIAAVIGFLLLKYVGDKNEAVQKAAGMPKDEQDRWIDKETVAQVKEIRKDAAHAPPKNIEVKTTKRGPFLRQTDESL